MAIKHVKEYYEQVCSNYKEAIEEIKEFEKEVEAEVIEPERIDALKSTLQPLITNYQQISYIMFLLNKPSRKSKESKYLGQNKKLLSQIAKENTSEGLLEQNKQILDKLRLI